MLTIAGGILLAVFVIWLIPVVIEFLAVFGATLFWWAAMMIAGVLVFVLTLPRH